MRGHRSALTAAVALLFLTTLTGRADAATISLGQMSFDQFLPPIEGDPTSVGTNAFNIFNSTGIYAAPIDPGVPPNPIDAVSLLGAHLLLTDAAGGDPLDISLGDIGPGLLDDGAGNPLFALQFPDTRLFSSAVFTATLGTLSFMLGDGSIFEAASADLVFTLAAGASGSLIPNPFADPLTYVPFEISGEIKTVPEPATGVLLGVGALVGLCGLARRRTRKLSSDF